jgi:glucokinase-like ROK family protein
MTRQSASPDQDNYNDFVDHSKMREMNLALILTRLRENQALSRSQLAEVTGLTKATISSLVKELIDRRFLHEVGVVTSVVGRPSISLELNPEAGYIIGAEIGVDFISVILTDFSAKVLWERSEKTQPGQPQDEILTQAITVIRCAMDEAARARKDVLGIGLGAPGLVDEVSGDLLYAPNLGWRDVPLCGMVAKAFHVPVYVDNEANMSALAESYFGAAREAEFVLYVSSGVGLGGGIVLKKQILKGASGFAGEIGHMTLDPNGRQCSCGNVGCWETLASQSAVFRRISEAAAAGRQTTLVPKPGARVEMSVSRVVEAARRGDFVALESLRETGRYLGIGMANLINALNPEIVVFGGTLSLAHEFLMPTILAEIERRGLYWSRQNTRLALSEFGASACVTGGVAAVYHRVLSQPSRMGE